MESNYGSLKITSDGNLIHKIFDGETESRRMTRRGKILLQEAGRAKGFKRHVMMAMIFNHPDFSMES